MATLIKKFQFKSDTEGWTGNPGDGQVTMEWFRPHKGFGSYRGGFHQDNDPLNSMGGALKTTAKQNAGSSENCWQWAGTWEDLGVPAGSTVTAVQGDYLYRWDFTGGGILKPRNYSVAEFGAEDVGSGPFELRDSGDTLIDTFSARQPAIDRTSGDLWRGYPVGDTHDPVSETPPSWAQANGSSISVPSELQASTSIIHLWLKNLTPLTAIWNPGDSPTYVRFKQDHIVLTITYTAATPPAVNLNSIIFSID